MSRLNLRASYASSPDFAVNLYCDGAVEVYTRGLSALAFVGKSTKPVFHSLFKSLDDRDAYLARFVEATSKRLKERAEFKERMRAERSASGRAFKEALKPGVILTASWGYEQTQVEFYRVEAVNGSTVTLQELGHIDVGATSWASCYVMPDLETKQGETITKRVSSTSRGIRLDSSIVLDLWDGSKRYKSWYY